IKLFNRLGFNAVFYASVMSGSRMPNLMYMTTFENKAVRDEHWKAFSDDPEWKALSAQPQYQHNVSRNETVFLAPTDYSDF
ncbi:MAG: NIPSNAP family protein, partial [Flavisolibacter sp.]|nr:NIPSNAP family protein [Flavisolibacter sp.]